MYRCDLCYTVLLKRNKTKHNQTKKHEYYSNLILNRYVINNIQVIKFKDMFNPYFIELSKMFKLSTICIFIRFDDDEDPRNHKISVSNNVTYNIHSKNYSTFTTELPSDFLHRVMAIYLPHECSPEIIPETEIVFISDLEDINREHYLEEPKSMLYRKLIRRFH